MDDRNVAVIAPDLTHFIESAGDYVTDPASALQALLIASRENGATCRNIADEAISAWKIAGPCREAIARIAEDADASGIDNAYHNPGHTRDVAIAWICLAALHDHLAATRPGLSPTSEPLRAAGIIAALGHDLLHEGNRRRKPRGARQDRPFRLEAMAAGRTAAIIAASGVAEPTGRFVSAAIIATEPVHGYAAIAEAERGAVPDGHPALPALADPGCRLVAAMLRDADIMTSAGLTAAEHARQAEQLTREIGANCGSAKGSERFFSATVGKGFSSPAGALFTPQLNALRAINAVRLRSGGGMTLAAAARRIAG